MTLLIIYLTGILICFLAGRLDTLKAREAYRAVAIAYGDFQAALATAIFLLLWPIMVLLLAMSIIFEEDESDD